MLNRKLSGTFIDISSKQKKHQDALNVEYILVHAANREVSANA